MAKHNILGKQGEEIAAEWVQRNGYKILDRNWRSGRNELDIVANIDEVVVVFEVKTRSTQVYDIAQLLPLKKRRSIIRAGANWLALHGLNSELRFDLLVVDIAGGSVDHYPEAIMVYDV